MLSVATFQGISDNLTHLPSWERAPWLKAPWMTNDDIYKGSSTWIIRSSSHINQSALNMEILNCFRATIHTQQLSLELITETILH